MDVAVEDAAKIAGARGVAAPDEGRLYLLGVGVVENPALVTGAGQGR